MKRMSTLLLCASALTMIMVGTAQAQQQQQVIRYVTATTFDVPFNDRAKVVSFMEEYFLPASQLNPNIKNFRMLTHNWGSDASQIVIVAEYGNWADIEAPCGKPCDDYNAQHPAPTEGQAGYAEFSEKAELFSKYFAMHHDEIYATNMRRAVVEGKMQGTVGPQPQGNM